MGRRTELFWVMLGRGPRTRFNIVDLVPAAFYLVSTVQPLKFFTVPRDLRSPGAADASTQLAPGARGSQIQLTRRK